MLLRFNRFRARSPGVSAHLLESSQAQVATNCKLGNGELKQFREPLAVNTPAKAGTKKTIYLFSGGYWFHWLTDVDVHRGPVANDAIIRTYYTGDVEPRMTYSPIAVTGGTQYPQNYYKLGIPAPVNAMTLTLGAGGGCAAAVQQNRAYAYTYVSALGEEGPPSPATKITGVCDGQTVNVGGMSVAPTGNYNITKKRIYRLVTGNTTRTYELVKEIDIATVSDTDAITDNNLPGSSLVSAKFDPPPAGLKGLGMLPNGIATGFDGPMLWLAEPNLPHAWPYFVVADDTIVATANYDTNIIVFTEKKTYLGSGVDPSAVTLSELPLNQVCVSKRGIASFNGGVIYPSPDGLVLIGPGVQRVITDNLYQRDDWQALKPDSILGVYHDGKYFGFYDTGTKQAGFIFDPDFGIIDIDTYATAAYTDPLTDSLHLQVGNDIVKWEGGTALKTGVWRTPKTTMVLPGPVTVGQVLAESYTSMTLNLYADGLLKHTQTVTDAKPFRMPGGYRARIVEAEITTKDTVREILLADNLSELSLT